MIEFQYLLGLSWRYLDRAERNHAKDGLRKGLLRIDSNGFLARGSHFVTFKIM